MRNFAQINLACSAMWKRLKFLTLRKTAEPAQKQAVARPQTAFNLWLGLKTASLAKVYFCAASHTMDRNFRYFPVPAQ